MCSGLRHCLLFFNHIAMPLILVILVHAKFFFITPVALLFLEAWLSIKDPHSGNDHAVIPEVHAHEFRATFFCFKLLHVIFKARANMLLFEIACEGLSDSRNVLENNIKNTVSDKPLTN